MVSKRHMWRKTLWLDKKKVWTKKYTLQGKTFEIVSSLCSLWDKFKALVTFIPLEASLSLYKLTHTKNVAFLSKCINEECFQKSASNQSLSFLIQKLKILMCFLWNWKHQTKMSLIT